jgi:GNAT superfamily N-acetyltransferase
MPTFAERARASVQRLQSKHWNDWSAFAAAHYGADSRQARAEWLTWAAANPVLGRDGIEVWISRRDDAIVGTQSGIPFRLKEADRTVSASWAVDLMVDPAWRLRGVGPVLSAAQRDAHEVVGAIGISDAAYRTYLRTGWVDLGFLPNYVRPIDIEWGSRAVGLIGWRHTAARLITPPALVATRLLSGGAARLSGTRLEAIDRFDERSDGIWRMACGSRSVISVRDREALSWRFDVAFDRASIRRYYLLKDSRAIGYVVTRVSHRLGRMILEILDYLAPPRWLLPLLGHVRGLSDARDAAAIACHALDPVGDFAFRLAGYVRLSSRSVAGGMRPAGGPPIRVMFHPRDGSDRPALHREQWFLTSLDSDLALWELPKRSGQTPGAAPGDASAGADAGTD